MCFCLLTKRRIRKIGRSGLLSPVTECEKLTEGVPSTYDLVLPEAYLGTEKEATQKSRVDCAQKSLNSTWLHRYKHSMVYVERTLSNGKIRRGLVGKIDLEHYDFSKDSQSAVRPTEGTVPERVTPRVVIREKAIIELPHIMVFMNDGGFDITMACDEKKNRMTKLYDFDLIQGGGHITGYHLYGDVLEEILTLIDAFETAKKASGEMAYGVGDGNHSLATAKTVYENTKKRDGGFAMNNKARYAAVEMVSINDEAIEFEPIYRLVDNIDSDDFVSYIKELSEAEGEETYPVTVVTAKGEFQAALPGERGLLTVGVVQSTVDKYMSTHSGAVVDYIHGIEETKTLAKKANSVGILFSGMEKNELFPYVATKGPLPKKTFSMGSADTKRYYLEARRIIK